MRSRTHITPSEGDLGCDFLSYIESQKRCSPLTVRNYRADIERFEAWLRAEYGSQMSCKSVRLEHIRAWIVARLDGYDTTEAISPASMNREIATLRSLYKWATARGRVGKNPMRAIQRLQTSTPLPHFIPRSEINQIVTPPSPESPPDWRALRDDTILAALYYTGLRLSEIASLRVSSFSTDFQTLKVSGKGNKERVIPVIEELRKKIFSLLDQIKPLDIWKRAPDLLFLSSRGAPLSTSMIYRIVRRELSEAGVKGRKSPHVVRHTFATHLLSQGADIRVIQELLGHSSLQATQRYTHNSIEGLKSSYAKAHPRGRVIKREGEL